MEPETGLGRGRRGCGRVKGGRRRVRNEFHAESPGHTCRRVRDHEPRTALGGSLVGGAPGAGAASAGRCGRQVLPPAPGASCATRGQPGGPLGLRCSRRPLRLAGHPGVGAAGGGARGQFRGSVRQCACGAGREGGGGGVSAVHLSRGLELARLQWARCTLWHLTNEVCVCVCECAYVHAHEAVLRTPNLLYARPSGLPSSILQTRLSARHTQSATLDVARGAARAGASAAFGSPQPEPGR